MDDKLPAGLLVSAQIRTAARAGIPITLRRRGDETRGVIILKINLLDGTARVLTQARRGDEIVWLPATKTDPMPEPEAEKYLEKQARIDPDSWLVEIEDKEGRTWFPGRVMSA